MNDTIQQLRNKVEQLKSAEANIDNALVLAKDNMLQRLTGLSIPDGQGLSPGALETLRKSIERNLLKLRDVCMGLFFSRNLWMALGYGYKGCEIASQVVDLCRNYSAFLEDYRPGAVKLLERVRVTASQARDLEIQFQAKLWTTAPRRD